MGKKSIRLITILTTVVLTFAVISAPASIFGLESAKPSVVPAYHKPNVSIICDREELGFSDVNGDPVYPIIYNGSTYLPVRAIAGLMGEDIEWEPLSQMIFIGKTLSMPSNESGSNNNVTASLMPPVPPDQRPEGSMLTVYLKPDVIIMFDFEQKNFTDVNGNPVYPIIYNGSTYLPVRAIAGLMGAEILWNGSTQTITIHRITVPVQVEKSPATVAMTELFNSSASLYDRTTGKIARLNDPNVAGSLIKLANSISVDYQMAQANTKEAKAMDTDNFTTQELAAHKKLVEYLELAEYFTLVLENVTYLAASDQDYSMFDGVITTFAMESINKMDDARAAIQAL